MGVPISSLPVASGLTGDEVFPIVQSGSTKQTTLNDIPYIPAGTGAVTTTVQSKLRETVSVKDFGATGDGSTNDAPAFTAAATYAASVDKDVMVPAPAVSYKLDSDPTVPANTNFFASPDWFSGTGKMPFHLFTELSEGVNPRVFSTKLTGYSETEPNETKRKWAVNGWVNYKNAPATGYEGTATDAVGVDGRGRTNVANGRVWGVVGLGQLDSGVSGVAQAYAAEFDINNNNANCAQDSALPAKGVVVVSGGNFRPEVAAFILTTKTPTNGLGDNRFFHGLRFYRDSCYEANIFIDDANSCDAMRIPSSSRGIHWTSNANLVNYYMRVSPANNHLELTIDQNQSLDVYNSVNQKVLAVGESSIEPDKPVGLSEYTYASIPASIDAGLADVVTFGVGGTVSGGITGGVNGQTITIVNASGSAVTISRNGNMRTAGGAAVTINNLCAVQFIRTGGVYFQLNSTTNA